MLLALITPPAHDDLLRRPGERQGDEQLREIVGGQRGDVGGGVEFATVEAAANGRAGGEPFDAVAVIGADGGDGVPFGALNEDVTDFGMRDAAIGSAVMIEPAADAGADGDIGHGIEAAARAKPCLGKGGGADVTVDGDGGNRNGWRGAGRH